MNKNDNGLVGWPTGSPGTNQHYFFNALLDSSLILATNNETYNLKVIECGNYIQTYSFNNEKLKKVKGIEKIEDTRKINFIDTDDLVKIDKNIDFKSNENKIEFKNANRSKFECQRIAKANSDEWKTLITLTFAENVTDIDFANKRFKYFRDKVRRVFKDFKYICVPEFQDRGAAHFHLLTNISIDDDKLIYLQEDNKKFKHIRYWDEGFTKVDNVNKNIKKIIGYISKYMSKDIDNRLFNHRRYFYSRNLNKPKTIYLDLNNFEHLEYYLKLINGKDEIYKNDYQSSYTQELITFREFL